MHAPEAPSINETKTGFQTAVHRTHKRRRAFAQACPRSTLILGTGSSFLYKLGMLVYLHDGSVRLLDMFEANTIEMVLGFNDMDEIFWKPYRMNLTRVELLHYQDGVLSMAHYVESDEDGEEETHIIALRVKPIEEVTLVFKMEMQPSRFWIRNNHERLVISVHEGMGSHGHHEWMTATFLLDPDRCHEAIAPALQLRDFFGTDISQTVAFEVFDGYLYAVSNQSSEEVEEIDWTSHYHCYRFPLYAPLENNLQYLPIWRRQHREGPINDTWTDLSLHKDEKTGEIFILECRREWCEGSSSQTRTFYRQTLDFAAISITTTPTTPTTLTLESSRPVLPDDRLARMINESDKPNYEAHPEPRLPSDYHSEPSATSSARTFLLAKTKHRAYNPSASAFLDLVIDTVSPATGSSYAPAKQALRLRIGARERYSPLDATTGLLYKPPPDKEHEGPDQRFRDRAIRMWPPADAPEELLELLTPNPSSVGEITALSDERSLVYMLLDPNQAEKRIVLVNFDAESSFEGLPEMQLSRDWQGIEGRDREVVLEREKGKGKGKAVDVMLGAKKYQGPSDGEGTEETREMGWRQETALWTREMRGFSFVYV